MATPIIPWIGGKRRLAKRILPIFPAHECYVEPFAGGAALFFLKDQSDVEVLNDINGELVNLYRVVKHHLEEFVRQFKWALISRQIYGWLKQTPEETLTDIQRAARFYYLQKMAFGLDQYARMAGLAKSIKGKMVISVNDIPEMRQVFDGLEMERLEISYTVGGAGRSKAVSGELLIRNW